MSARRAVDVAAGLVGLAAALPAMALTALWLRAAAGSPVIFVQPRATLGGQGFRLVKFRTMRALDPARPLADADRLVPGGALIRRLRLDELPQLLHVVLGEMSLIGPRPLLAATLDAAGEAGRARGRVRPGLTGWAQVNGNARLSDRDKLALDLWWIDHRSLRLDLLILARTLLVPLLGERPDPLAIRRAHAGGPGRRG